MPVDEVDVAVGAPFHVDGPDVFIAADEEVFALACRVTAAVRLKDVLLN